MNLPKSSKIDKENGSKYRLPKKNEAENTMDTDTRKTIIEIAFILVLVLLGAIGSGFLAWYVILGGIVAALIAYLTIMCTKCQGKMGAIERLVKSKLSQVKGLQEYLEGKMVILDTDEIIGIEKNAKEVWISTYDISYDLGPFLDTIANNIDNDKTYRYFLSSDLEDDFEELKHKIGQKLTHKEKIKRLEVTYVESSLIPLNMVLYDPIEQRHGYIYVPEEKTNFFVKFNEKSFGQVRKYFRKLGTK